MALIDLTSFTTLNGNPMMVESATSSMYVSKSSLPAAVAYYQAEPSLRGAGKS